MLASEPLDPLRLPDEDKLCLLDADCEDELSFEPLDPLPLPDEDKLDLLDADCKDELSFEPLDPMPLPDEDKLDLLDADCDEDKERPIEEFDTPSPFTADELSVNEAPKSLTLTDSSDGDWDFDSYDTKLEPLRLTPTLLAKL